MKKKHIKISICYNRKRVALLVATGAPSHPDRIMGMFVPSGLAFARPPSMINSAQSRFFVEEPSTIYPHSVIHINESFPCVS